MRQEGRFALWFGIALAAVAAGVYCFVVYSFARSEPDTAPVAVAVPVGPAPVPLENHTQLPTPDPPKPEQRTVAASSDPFELIRSLAKAAYDGDGKTQYRVSRELDRCEYTLTLVRKEPNDPETAILNFPWEPEMKDRAIAEYRRCIRLMKEDPFADLPPRKGGYTFQYWMQRSVQSGYSLAVVSTTVQSLLAPVTNPDAQKARSKAVDALAHAVVSDEPDAALIFGLQFSYSSSEGTSVDGAAWMLAACRLGADCGANSSIYPFFMCSVCAAGMDVELAISSGFGPAQYAEAYARSQVIEEALRGKDLPTVTNLMNQLVH